MNALQQYHEELNTLEAQRAELAAKIRATDSVEQQAEQAKAAIQEATTKRRGLLARVFLGEATDTAPADAELSAAQQQAEAIADAAEGAQAARELLQAQIDDINRRAAKIRADMEVARWEAARAEVSKLASDYREACDAAEAAYLELVGMAQVADSLRPVESAPRCFNLASPMEIHFADMPMPELEGFRTYRRLYDLRGHAEQAARERFAEIVEARA